MRISTGPTSRKKPAIAIATGAASENASTFAVRDTAEGSKHRTIIATVKALFRKVAAAVVRRVADALHPKTRRRRSGDDTRDAFAGMARKIMRRIERPPAYASAAVIMSETLDWLHVWHHHDSAAASGSDHGAGFDAQRNHLSPHL